MAEFLITEGRTLVGIKMGNYRDGQFSPMIAHEPAAAFEWLKDNEEHVRVNHLVDAATRNNVKEVLDEIERWKTSRLELAWLIGDKDEVNMLLTNHHYQEIPYKSRLVVPQSLFGSSNYPDEIRRRIIIHG